MSRNLTKRQRTAQQKKSAIRKRAREEAVDIMTEEELLAGLQDLLPPNVADLRA